MKYLVVDDEPMVRAFLERYLTIQGHSVVGAGSGQAGFELAVREQPQVIITDYELGDETGVAMLQRLKKTLMATPLPRIILMSGLGREFFERLATEGMEDLLQLFLSKPFNLSELQQITPLPPLEE